MLSASAGLKQRFSNRRGVSAPLFFSVLVMQNDSTSNYVMAGIYRALIVVSALVYTASFPAISLAAWNPPKPNLTVTKSATGSGAFSLNNNSISKPLGVTVAPAPAASNVIKFPNSLAQPVSGTISVPSGSGSLVTNINGTVHVPNSAVKSAAKSFLRASGWASLPFLAVDGFDLMLDALGWYYHDGMVWAPPDDPDLPSVEYPPVSTGSRYYRVSPDHPSYQSHSTPYGACSAIVSDLIDQVGYAYDNIYITSLNPSGASSYTCNYKFIAKVSGNISTGSSTIVAYNSAGPCSTGTEEVDGACAVPSTPSDPVAVTPSDFEAAIDEHYDPQPSDFEKFINQPEFVPNSIEFEPVPSIVTEPVITTKTDAITGDVTVTEQTTTYDFALGQNPSTQPNVSVNESVSESTYKNGNLVSSSNTSTLRPPVAAPNAPPSGSGSGSGSGAGFELPSFCTWASVVCGFIDWVKAEPDLPDENLDGVLNEVAITSESFTFTAPDAACPAPLVLNLSQFGSREVSYQPLCDLASTMKFLYLALMSFAAAVLLHRSISRV